MSQQLTFLKKELHLLGDAKKARILQRFFKTGKGQYGEGDVFWGITVPKSRSLAIKYKDLFFEDITELLKSKIHEERLIAVLILVHNFKNGDERERKRIYSFYLKNTRYINNWDLVDLSADKIVGAYLLTHPRGILKKLAHSQNIWERRIAIISTFQFIKNGDAKDALIIGKMLLFDKHDLIQKAVGWMLREVGKRVSIEAERQFLDIYAHKMPRTTLRYAIEKMPKEERRAYLSK